MEGMPASRSTTGRTTLATRPGGHLGEEHGHEEADGHADDDGAGGAVDGGEDHGQDAELGLLRRGGPLLAEEEVRQADLPDGGQARDDEVDGDDQHEGDGDEAADEEDHPHHRLQRAHASAPALPRGVLLHRLPVGLAQRLFTHKDQLSLSCSSAEKGREALFAPLPSRGSTCRNKPPYAGGLFRDRVCGICSGVGGHAAGGLDLVGGVSAHGPVQECLGGGGELRAPPS